MTAPVVISAFQKHQDAALSDAQAERLCRVIETELPAAISCWIDSFWMDTKSYGFQVRWFPGMTQTAAPDFLRLLGLAVLARVDGYNYVADNFGNELNPRHEMPRCSCDQTVRENVREAARKPVDDA